MSAISPNSSFVQRLPQDTRLAAVKSFVASATLTTILSGGNLGLALGVGAFAATVSTVEALTRPIFNKIFSCNPVYKHIAATAIATCAFAPLCGLPLSFLASFGASLMFDIADGAFDRPYDTAHTFVLI